MKYPSLPDISTLTKFTLPESNWLEYKAAATACMLNKIPATICAMLNSDGGYIVVGVEDDNLQILGLGVKEYDRLALYVDNIYRSGAVLTEEGKTLPLNTLKVFSLTAANSKRVAVIQITPDEDKKYKLKNNEMYYRLSASNFRYTLERRMFTPGEMEAYASKRVAAFQQAADQSQTYAMRLSEDYKALLKKTQDFERKCLELSAKVDETALEAKDLKEEVQRTNDWLKSSIMKSKEIRERELEEESKGTLLTVFSRLLCL
jgi:predicted HTH transcriptional regulator